MIYLKGIGGCILVCVTYVRGYIGVEILSELGCVCCIREQVAHSPGSLRYGQPNFDGGRCLHCSVPIDHVTDEFLICQRSFVDTTLVLAEPFVSALYLVMMDHKVWVSLLARQVGFLRSHLLCCQHVWIS